MDWVEDMDLTKENTKTLLHILWYMIHIKTYDYIRIVDGVYIYIYNRKDIFSSIHIDYCLSEVFLS